MECNKDEASKAKVIAEKMITENDFAGAKKFALKAHALYPRTEGLSQLMRTIIVYISAEKKVSRSIGGLEVDWYGVLGVTPTADDETIKKQYRKLALMIHPDKNKCVGADGAFKLVSEAWSLLSDKDKRYAYDQRRVCFINNNGYVFTNNNYNNCWWSSSSSPQPQRTPNINTNTNTNASTSLPPPPVPPSPNSDPMYIIRWNLATKLKNEWEKANEEIMKRAREEEEKGTKKRRKKRAAPGPHGPSPDCVINPLSWFILRLCHITCEEFESSDEFQRGREEKAAAQDAVAKKQKAKKERKARVTDCNWTTPSPSGDTLYWYLVLD